MNLLLPHTSRDWTRDEDTDAYSITRTCPNAADLQHYVHGMFDMIYTLDYLEGLMVARVMLLPVRFSERWQLLYARVEYGKAHPMLVTRRTFTAEEIASQPALNL